MGAIPNIVNKADKGYVTDQKWFGAKEQFQKLDHITLEHAERVLNYEVTKEPLFFRPQTDGPLNPYTQVDKAFCLYRPDINKVLWPNVGDDYTVAPNSQLLKHVEALLVQGRENNLGIEIDSVLTLGSGQSSIVNLKIAETYIQGDQSKTVTKMLMSNAFGGNALQTCFYNMRMWCANMSRMIFKQGKSNGTYRKIRHTKNVNKIFDNAICELQDIVFNINTYNKTLSELNKIEVNTEYVENFLENLFPIKEKEGRGLTINTNKQEEILNLFEGKDDLKHLPMSRYRLLNAVTDFTSQGGMLRTHKDNDGKRFVSQINGQGDKLNRQALELLTV